MKRLIFILPLAFLLTACPDSTIDEDLTGEKPEGTAENIEIRLSVDGGMMPVTESIYISRDSAYWSLWRSQHTTKINWTPTKEQIDNIYEVMVNNHYSEIKSDCEGEVFDRGGTDIYFTVDGEKHEIRNSQNCFIKEKWGSSYAAINKAIRSHADEEIAKQMFEIQVDPQANLINSGYLLTLNINNEVVYKYDGDAPAPRDMAVYPGYNEVYLQLFYKDSTTSYGSPKTYISGQEYINITQGATKLQVDLKEDEFELIVLP